MSLMRVLSVLWVSKQRRYSNKKRHWISIWAGKRLNFLGFNTIEEILCFQNVKNVAFSFKFGLQSMRNAMPLKPLLYIKQVKTKIQVTQLTHHKAGDRNKQWNYALIPMIDASSYHFNLYSTKQFMVRKTFACKITSHNHSTRRALIRCHRENKVFPYVKTKTNQHDEFNPLLIMQLVYYWPIIWNY